MLVLSRRKNETIECDVDGVHLITLTIVEIRGDKVRLGLEAPVERVKFHRNEIARQCRESIAAAVATTGAVA